MDPSDPRTLPENSVPEMQAKYDALNRYLTERTIPIFEQRSRDGLFEHISDEGIWRGGTKDEERREIYQIRLGRDANGKDLGIDRDALPRWQYPDLYVYKDEVYRLEKLMQERRIEEAQAAAPR